MRWPPQGSRHVIYLTLETPGGRVASTGIFAGFVARFR